MTVFFPKRRAERGDTAAVLAAANEVLFAKEWCVETDTGRWKFGDGVTAWNLLPYSIPGFYDPTGLADGDTWIWDAALERFVPGTVGGGTLPGGLTCEGGSVELTAALLPGFSVSKICNVNLNAFTRWRLVVWPAGSLTLDIRVAAAQTPMPLLVADSIVAAAPPFVTADTDNTSTSLTGWGTSIARGSSVTVAVLANSGVKWFSLEVEGTRTP